MGTMLPVAQQCAQHSNGPHGRRHLLAVGGKGELRVITKKRDRYRCRRAAAYRQRAAECSAALTQVAEFLAPGRWFVEAKLRYILIGQGKPEAITEESERLCIELFRLM